MEQTNLLAIYFLMGLLLGGVSGALYIVASVKYHKINFEQLKYSAFNQLVIFWIIVAFIILLATTVLK